MNLLTSVVGVRRNFNIEQIRRSRPWQGFAFRFTEGWIDSLAQSFLVEANGGMFLSSVDFFLRQKVKALLINVQIRTMVKWLTLIS